MAPRACSNTLEAALKPVTARRKRLLPRSNNYCRKRRPTWPPFFIVVGADTPELILNRCVVLESPIKVVNSEVGLLYSNAAQFLKQFVRGLFRPRREHSCCIYFREES